MSQDPENPRATAAAKSHRKLRAWWRRFDRKAWTIWSLVWTAVFVGCMAINWSGKWLALLFVTSGTFVWQISRSPEKGRNVTGKKPATDPDELAQKVAQLEDLKKQGTIWATVVIAVLGWLGFDFFREFKDQREQVVAMTNQVAAAGQLIKRINTVSDLQIQLITDQLRSNFPDFWRGVYSRPTPDQMVTLREIALDVETKLGAFSDVLAATANQGEAGFGHRLDTLARSTVRLLTNSCGVLATDMTNGIRVAMESVRTEAKNLSAAADKFGRDFPRYRAFGSLVGTFSRDVEGRLCLAMAELPPTMGALPVTDRRLLLDQARSSCSSWASNRADFLLKFGTNVTPLLFWPFQESKPILETEMEKELVSRMVHFRADKAPFPEQAEAVFEAQRILVLFRHSRSFYRDPSVIRNSFLYRLLPEIAVTNLLTCSNLLATAIGDKRILATTRAELLFAEAQSLAIDLKQPELVRSKLLEGFDQLKTVASPGEVKEMVQRSPFISLLEALGPDPMRNVLRQALLEIDPR